MKKILYTLLLLSLVLTSCSKSSDDDVTPPPPPPSDEYTEESILGTWETYYFMKYVTVKNSDGTTSTYGNLRYIEYDGFKTKYYKDPDGSYVFDSYNPLNYFVHKGTYLVMDSLDGNKNAKWIKHFWHTTYGNDTIVTQKLLEVDVRPGILKTNDIYKGTTNKGGDYTLSDAKLHRNVSTAPKANDYIVTPKKDIKFDDYTEGTWEFAKAEVRYDGSLQSSESTTITKELAGTKYKLHYTGSQKMVEWTLYDTNGVEYIYDCPAIQVDDVIHYFFREEIKDKEGNKKIVDSGAYFNITDRKDMNGYDTFIDLKDDRYREDPKITRQLRMYYRRIPDVAKKGIVINQSKVQ